MKNYIIKHHYRIKKYDKLLFDRYNQNVSILNLSAKYDISPITIIRYIFEKKYNKKLNYLIKSNILSEYDLNQYNLANKFDIYSRLEQTDMQTASIEFEKQIEELLIKHNIKYQTQEELTVEQKNIYGHAINTPDFLIKSDLIINSSKINWIDAKNFYGSNIDFIKSKIAKQIKKYIESYGSGCIIFSYGFNEKLMFDNVLILSYETFC